MGQVGLAVRFSCLNVPGLTSNGLYTARRYMGTATQLPKYLILTCSISTLEACAGRISMQGPLLKIIIDFHVKFI